MAQDVNNFFAEYSAAYTNYDADKIVTMYSVPSLIMSDDAKVAINDRYGLKENTEHVLSLYKEVGMKSVSPSICHILKLSDKMRFVTLDWSFLSANNEVIFNCKTSYTLQLSDDGFKIVAIVVDDENDAYANAMKRIQMKQESE